MDGVHDMGGMHGFGPVRPGDDAPLRKDDWRGRMFGIELSVIAPEGFSIDWFRHVNECIPAAVYLGSEYFDRWYLSLAAMLIDAGWVTPEELESGRAESTPEGLAPPMPPERVTAAARASTNVRRPAAGPAAFEVDRAVRAKTLSPLGHTRLPRYVRGRTGRVEACYGWQLLPDACAAGEERAEPLYSVSFLARDLWGDVTAPRDRVFVDLWESYLEPA